ncbi:MAG: hypothetical protein ACPGGN_03625 [Opitutales bacterium]
MTSEENDLINLIRSKGADLKSKERAIVRLGESLEETFILDLLPSKRLIKELVDVSEDNSIPVTLRRKVKVLLKNYSV